MIDAKLSSVEDLVVSVSPTDAAGNPAPIQAGSLTVVSDNPSVIASGVEQPDGSFKCVTAGIGTALLTVSADADVGEGVETIQDQISVTVDAAKAKNLGLTVTAVPK